jgi:putative glycosyltransferase
MKLSIVTTLYYSAPYLEEFYTRITEAARPITEDYEIILVNDGSPDESLGMAIRLYEADSHVRVVDLSRNFGHHKAAMTGLAQANGDLVFLIDSDLEEEPELLTQFYEIYRQAGDADVVYGVQAVRQGSFVKRVLGALYYRIFNLLSSENIPEDLLMARLMTRRYVTNLVAHQEREIDISGLWTITGFKQIPLSVSKHSRDTTTYSFRKRLALMVRGITAFSNRPLIMIAGLGVLILIASFAYFVYIMSIYLFVGRPPTGFTTLILSVWFLGGLTIFSLGVIAIYLSVIFIETKNRPYTIIRQIYERNNNG